MTSAAQRETQYKIEEILRLLPHRFPFLLVDRVEELHRPAGGTRAGWKSRARKCVSMNEPYFPGHFPHRPVMPGVLQIEAMAQAAALICVHTESPPMDVAIAAVDKARFRRPVTPGDVIEITAEIIKDRGQILVIACKAMVDGNVVSEAELIAKMFPIQEN
jgi:3-hydroxyacyl-[acyl-carrier-protein] dehydratase